MFLPLCSWWYIVIVNLMIKTRSKKCCWTKIYQIDIYSGLKLTKVITTGSHEKGFHHEPMSNRREKKTGKLLKARENADVWLVHNMVRVFFDQSHTEVYENRSPPGLLSTFERKLLDACSYIWTGSASIGTNLSVFQLCKPRIGFLFLKILFRFFFHLDKFFF